MRITVLAIISLLILAPSWSWFRNPTPCTPLISTVYVTVPRLRTKVSPGPIYGWGSGRPTVVSPGRTGTVVKYAQRSMHHAECRGCPPHHMFVDEFSCVCAEYMK